MNFIPLFYPSTPVGVLVFFNYGVILTFGAPHSKKYLVEDLPEAEKT